MKKMFFVAASAALVLSSCSNDVEESAVLPNKKAPKEVKVGVYTPGLTRTNAEEASLSSLEELGFQFMAQYLVNELDGEKLEEPQYLVLIEPTTFGAIKDPETEVISWMPATFDAESSAWYPTEEVLYWPESLQQEVEFYGLFSANNESLSYENLEPGTPNLEVVVYSGEDDIMAASKITSYSMSNNGAVDLRFEHILAGLRLNIKRPAVDAAYSYYLKKAILRCVNKGSYNFNTSEMSMIDGAETGEWVLKEDASVYDESNVYGSCYVIPDENAYIELTYSVELGGTSLYEENPTVTIQASQFTLAAGVMTDLNITLPAPGQQEVKVNVEVGEWEETSKDVE